MRPYFNLADKDLMVDRIVEEFAWAHDVQQEGLRALAYMKEHDCKGIVLAGRPYHVDPEVNHGIPETICALGMVVLSEDSVSELTPGQHLNLTEYLSKGERDPRAKDAHGFSRRHQRR